MEPLAAVLTDNFLRWLPKETYPVRSGLHANSSFGLSLALPYARRQAVPGQPATAQPSLGAAIEAAARRWYAADFGYPAAWEPSGHDFLSPALAEAELMARVLPAEEFGPWLAAFLPGLASGSPASLFTPVVVSDSSDGQIAHLQGSTSAAPGASAAWPRPCRPATRASRPARRPHGGTPKLPCPTWWATTTWSPTGSRRTPSCCSAEKLS